MFNEFYSLVHGTYQANKSGAILRYKNFKARTYNKEFEIAKNFATDAFEKYQQEKLKDVIEYCINNVSYYRQNKDKYLLHGKEVNLELFPVIEKGFLRKNTEMFFPENFTGRYRKQRTSGTSGTPLSIRKSYKTHYLFAAGLNRYKKMFGLDECARTVCLTGFFTPALNKSNLISWKDFIGKRLFLSIYQINDDRAKEYSELLNKFKPEGVFGYASSVYLLAALFKRNNLKAPNTLKVALTTSEVLLPSWRDLISEVFGIPVSDQYGSIEGQCLATECPAGSMHINPEHGIIEVVDENYHTLEDGKEGDFLLTGLVNDAMPLIRYAIGDRGIVRKLAKPCRCGLQWPIIQSISGRSEDAILTPDGRPIMYLNFHCTKYMEGIIESQFIQDAGDHIKVLLVVDKTFDRLSEEKIKELIKMRTQYDFKADFEYMNNIPRGARGKFKAVVNLLNK